jgi:hypothetical protein
LHVAAATTLWLSTPAIHADTDSPRELQLLGWVENAFLVAPGIELPAKLDTGANTSSLDARIIKRFRQWGRRWVRFAVRDPDTGEEVVMVRERARTIGIVQHEGDSDVRPTVKVEVCIAGIQREIEVSLVDRGNFNYPLLLGRRALRHFAIVHPGETFIAAETCPDDPDRDDIVLDPSASDPDKAKRSRRSDAAAADTGPEQRDPDDGEDQESWDEDRDEDVILEDDDSQDGDAR